MTQLLSFIADWMGSLSCLFGYPWHINSRIAADPLKSIPENRLTTRRGLPWGLPSCNLFRSELLIRDFLFHLRARPTTTVWAAADSRMLDQCPNIFGRSFYTTIGCLLEISSKSLWLKKTAMAANELSPNRLIISNQSLQRGMILKRYS